MDVVVRCPHCDWVRLCQPSIAEMIKAGAELDEHLVGDHDISFNSATRAAESWVAASSRRLLQERLGLRRGR